MPADSMSNSGARRTRLLRKRQQEDQANWFAGDSLAPPEEVRPQLQGLTLRDFSKLAELKLTWGMSMAALIQRAKDLDCISVNQ
jgi:Zn-dependent peptidase ImmA (M78 family)